MFGFIFRLFGRMFGFALKATLFIGALIVVGAATMYALFDAEAYRRVVTQRLVDITGRAVSINGPVELHISLPPSVVLNDVRIRNARWGTRSDMARIGRVEARLNPLRAIAGDSGMTDIRLEGVDLYLETGPGGIGNWEFSSIATGAGVALGALAILDALGLLNPRGGGSFTVSNLSLSFRDGVTGRTQAVSLGGTALELAGGGGAGGLAAPGHMTVAAITDKREDPCEKEKDGPLSLR